MKLITLQRPVLIVGALLRCLIAAWGLCNSLGAAAQVPLEPTAFASVVMQSLSEKAGNSAQVSLTGPLAIRLVNGSGRVVDARLEPLHKQCVIQSGFCRDAIKRYVDSSLEMIAGAPVEPQEEQLRVLVRDSSFASQLIETHSRANSSPPVMKRYLPDLWMVLAVAGDSVMWIASTALIERLGLDETSAFDLALKNTRAAMRRLAHVARPLGQSPFSFSVGDNDSSRLLMHSDWGVLAQAQKGKLLVAVPDADMIIFGTVRSDADLKRFKDAAAQAARGSANPLSGNIYHWRQDGWEAVTLQHVAHPHPAGGPGFGP